LHEGFPGYSLAGGLLPMTMKERTGFQTHKGNTSIHYFGVESEANSPLQADSSIVPITQNCSTSKLPDRENEEFLYPSPWDYLVKSACETFIIIKKTERFYYLMSIA
jgi:hypothetical protein